MRQGEREREPNIVSVKVGAERNGEKELTREIPAEGYLKQTVKLMYDRTDWFCVSDTSDKNIVRESRFQQSVLCI